MDMLLHPEKQRSYLEKKRKGIPAPGTGGSILSTSSREPENSIFPERAGGTE